MKQLTVDKLSKLLTEHKLWGTPFRKIKVVDLEKIAEIFFESIDPDSDTVSPPFIRNGELNIPYNASLKYRWWDGGQSVRDTLVELGASQDVINKYCGIMGGG